MKKSFLVLSVAFLLTTGSVIFTSCGNNTENTTKKEPAKEEPAMKCGEGKCGDSIKEEKPKKVAKGIPEKVKSEENKMKCAPGKCG